MATLDVKNDPTVLDAIVTVLKAGLGVDDGMEKVWARYDGLFVVDSVAIAPEGERVFASPEEAAVSYIQNLSDD